MLMNILLDAELYKSKKNDYIYIGKGNFYGKYMKVVLKITDNNKVIFMVIRDKNKFDIIYLPSNFTPPSKIRGHKVLEHIGIIYMFKHNYLILKDNNKIYIL